MVPEILIVGDPTRRRELIDKVRECHYDVTLCAARELNRRVRTGPAPGAIILCIGDVDATLLLAGLRRSRQGAAIPVVLSGTLGGEIRDLADVLDLGADHFLEDPIETSGLHDVLLELVGPASGRTETQIDADMGDPMPTQAAAERRRRERSGRSLGMVTERLEEREPPRPERGRGGQESARDPMLGQLHRTLDRLEARLRDRAEDVDLADDDPGEDIDLARLGADSIPSIEGEDNLDPADSGAELRFEDSHGAGATDDVTDIGFPEPRRRRSSDRGGRIERAEQDEWPEDKSAVLRGRRPSRDGSSRGDGARRVTRPTVPRSGSFEDQDVPRLLWRLHEDRFSGLARLQRGRAQKLVWLEGGEVVFVRSNLSTDRFVDGLLRRGVLTRPQYETARRLAAKQPTRAGRLLVEAGFVKPREMHRLLQDHLTRVLDSTFSWTDGSWTLEPGESTDERVRIETSMPVMILEGIRFRLETEDLHERLGGRILCPRLSTHGVTLEERAEQVADALQVLPEEERCLANFDGKHTLAELAEDAAGDEHAVLALIYALLVLGDVELLGEPEPEAGNADLDQVDTERIVERVRLAREADYFALLGLERDASRADVRRAFAELSATFADQNLEPATRETLERELGELRSGLAEARDVLTDDAIRSAYLAHLGEP